MKSISTIIFDLDETLTDRPLSIARYLKAFALHFNNKLQTSFDLLSFTNAVIEVDQGGYAGHNKRWRWIIQQPIWKTDAPAESELLDHWFAYFPYNPVAMEGLNETLGGLHRRGYKLGLIKNGKIMCSAQKSRHCKLSNISLRSPHLLSSKLKSWMPESFTIA